MIVYRKFFYEVLLPLVEERPVRGLDNTSPHEPLAHNDKMIAQLMQGSSSVGGARAKTLIALNPETNAVRSGQINAGEGFEYWLFKENGKADEITRDDCIKAAEKAE